MSEELEDIEVEENPTKSFLHTRNILVKIETRSVGNERKDDVASDAVANEFQTAANMGRYVKHLFDPKSLRRINNIRNQISTSMPNIGIPWKDGFYVINVSSFESFRKMCSTIRKQWDNAVAEWLKKYDAHVEEAKTRLGKLFDPNQYPSSDVIEGYFEFRPRYKPIPHSEDLDRLILTSDDILQIEEISDSVNQEVHRLTLQGMKWVWEKLHNMLERIVNRIDEGNRINRNNTMLDTLRTVIQYLPQFNLTQDNDLSTIYNDLNKSVLSTVDISDLQGEDEETKAVKTNVRDTAKEFMDRIEEELEKIPE